VVYIYYYFIIRRMRIMALSNKMNEQGVKAPTQEETKVVKGTSASDQFRAEGAKARETMSADEKAVEGSKSDMVAFVAALGNPARKQDRVEGNKSIPCYEVVGYEFKALEDMVVPFIPLKSADSFNVGEESERQVKAGETFHLTIYETAMLISRIEYAGKFSGEGDAVVLSAKSSKNRTTPLPILKKAASQGSIKSNIKLVADMIGDANGGKGTPKVKEEYAEKFTVLFQKKVVDRNCVGKVAKTGEAAADLAAAFRKALKK
jgi:hypothetical protein